MKPIIPLCATAAAVLCAASLSVGAAPSTPAQAQAQAITIADGSGVPAAVHARPARSEHRPAATRSWSPGERGARAAAEKGPDALRRYIDRTRMIYALRFEDFADIR